MAINNSDKTTYSSILKTKRLDTDILNENNYGIIGWIQE